MNSNDDKQLARIRQRLARARKQGAQVVVEHDRGEEVYHVQRDAEGRVAWHKVKGASATRKPGDAA